MAPDPDRYGPRGYHRREVFSWALYDWGNSAFATTVMAAFFPIFLGEYWITDGQTNSTFVLGNANGLSSLLIVLSAPILGAIADRCGARKRFLAFFAFLGVLMTALLYVVSKGHWELAALLFVVAAFGFSGANVFYDSLLVAVARTDKRDIVSALGYSMGYIGGAILFSVNVLMTLHPDWFGLRDAAHAVRVSFVTVAVWWAVFTLPVLLWVREPPTREKLAGWAAIRAGFRELGETLAHIRQLKHVATFLVAYWLYIDGVDTIVRMAVDYGRQLGFGTNDLITALLITNAIGFPATLIYGRVAERVGAKTGILFAIAVYTVTTALAYFMSSTMHFYMLAIVIGLVQGGVQALSRSLYSRMIPQEKSAEFFGFYNMLGKFAAVIGPIMVGWVSVLSGSPRLAILSVIVLFIAGGTLLLRVPEPTDAS